VILGEMMAAPEVPPEPEQPSVMSMDSGTPGVGGGDEGGAEDDGGTSLPSINVSDLVQAGSVGDAGGEGEGTGGAPIPPLPPTQKEEIQAAYEDLKQRATDALTETYQRGYIDKCRSVPMRLTEEERRLLKVLVSALNVSEYTDNVDTMSRKSKTERIIEELENLFSIILGLMVCSDVNKGHQLVDSRSMKENAEFFRHLFEVGRRYKIMNPDRMRGTYGKLMYMLQDTQTRLIQARVGFSCVKDVLTVYSFLEAKGCVELLRDPRTLLATRDIHDGRGKKSREQIAADVATKQMAAKELKEEYGKGDLSPDDVQRVVDSIADSNNYLTFNVGPVRRLINLLKNNFTPDDYEKGFSLQIGGGGRTRLRGSFSSYYGSSYGSSYFRSDSAKLSHDHSTQYTYVNQSLKLWKTIMGNMYKLWHHADYDLLSTSTGYQLWNTGQGLNRVQSCPLVSGEMRRILSEVQRTCGPWVGLSVVHLGDRDVPNALMFIDKYTQVPRILAPISRIIDQIGTLFEDEVLKQYAETVWTDAENLKMHILVDFFKHGFDGDGDDGGSCIDGRLTSAWNWCSKISKKPYYNAFMLCGFSGFDGE